MKNQHHQSFYEFELGWQADQAAIDLAYDAHQRIMTEFGVQPECKPVTDTTSTSHALPAICFADEDFLKRYRAAARIKLHFLGFARVNDEYSVRNGHTSFGDVRRQDNFSHTIRRHGEC
jgi:hypothetical protein